MICRHKNQVEKLMPKKDETKVLCLLSNKKVFWYTSFLLKDINSLTRDTTMILTVITENESTTTSDSSGSTGKISLCCIHPYLFDGTEVDMDTMTLEDLIAISGKITMLEKICDLYAKRSIMWFYFLSLHLSSIL